MPKVKIPGINIMEEASKRGLKYQTVYKRLDYGWTLEEALGEAPRAKRKRPRADGGAYPDKSVRELSEERGINPGVVRGRLQIGWTLAQALGEEDRQKRAVLDGQFSFGDITRLATENGISRGVLYQRLRGGWDLNKALKTKVRTKDDELYAVAERFGLTPKTMKTRLDNGWSLEEALGLKRRLTPNFDYYELDGETKTLPTWCSEIGIALGTAYNRLWRGWTIAQTLEKEPPPPRPAREKKPASASNWERTRSDPKKHAEHLRKKSVYRKMTRDARIAKYHENMRLLRERDPAGYEEMRKKQRSEAAERYRSDPERREKTKLRAWAWANANPERVREIHQKSKATRRAAMLDALEKIAKKHNLFAEWNRLCKKGRI